MSIEWKEPPGVVVTASGMPDKGRSAGHAKFAGLTDEAQRTKRQ
jgi:hypothetical protein